MAQKPIHTRDDSAKQDLKLWRYELLTQTIVDAEDGHYIAMIRGWGRLTGKGHAAHGLPRDEAIAIQDAIGERIAKLPELEAKLAAQPAWQPIETAPKDETPILVYGGYWEGEVSGLNSAPHDEAEKSTIVQYDGRRYSVCGGDYYATWVRNPTHWMPLPKSPKP